MFTSLSLYQGMANLPFLCSPLPSTLAAQWALLDASLLSFSCLAHARLLAACLWPSPSLDTFPSKQADTALADTKLSSLLKSWRMRLLSHSSPSLPRARPLALSLESARHSRRWWRSLLVSWKDQFLFGLFKSYHKFEIFLFCQIWSHCSTCSS